jgi:hypothetical protein
MFTLKKTLTIISILNATLFTSCSSTGEIKGKVIYANQLSASGIIVYTTPSSNSVLTNMFGEYGISNLTPGEYNVTAKTNGVNADSVSQMVTVREGEIRTCDLSF